MAEKVKQAKEGPYAIAFLTNGQIQSHSSNAVN